MPLTLYDIPSKFPGRTLSPCVWRARLSINYKGLSCNTAWIEFPDIEDVSKQLGVAPTGTWPDGTDYYSCPALVDDTQDEYAAISDSFRIVQYLETAYPDTKKVLPETEEGIQFQKDFPSYFEHTVYFPFAAIFLPYTLPVMTERGREHYTRARSLFALNKPWIEEPRTEEERQNIWDNFRAGCKKLNDDYYAKTNENGLWMFGETPTYADFVVVAFFFWINLAFPVGTPEWDMIREWDNGRWGRMFDEAQQWKGGF